MHTITILPGHDRHGDPEGFDAIHIAPGDTLSIVGPTGSGKSALINDIEVFAQGDTATGRTILLDGAPPPESSVRDPAKKPIALITQTTKCLADLRVEEFLGMHLRARKITDTGLVEKAIRLANEFTGEPIRPDCRISSLSGGQTRSLLVADAVIISGAPIILLDEVENAGIFRDRVITCLKKTNTSVIFVTHDPLVSLMSDKRIVMGNGAVKTILEPDGSEAAVLKQVTEIDAYLSDLRERLRAGEILGEAVPQA
ncbi:MAG: ATP-binding cassette domain-containing protein [Methanocalculus sp. MSAO_Arc1]|uniref:ATP-binding cassette domain-containing protein n=1 Tax=Methanocalculus TaxID=71151 RepID=UPI000FEEE410|nr:MULTISPECIES: ATP-binding cassette domain-containing protein [unclassified Methanocalculus]MCP1661487.1 ABC-type lipoprotein export system ATPase subunit [Methanocalculus sp. AMF5]RQD79763.1 MAG: ATP-binding cassette domain-containing protein [Methanocalculus sp. MSAO_Arc1]